MPLRYLKLTTMIEAAPISFVPYFKTVIWGGNKICKFKGITQPEPNIGESWEISSVPGHESIVAEGIYKGKTITELASLFGAELLGTKVAKKYGGKFPLLIKFIDAADNLSVQVHPDDELAKKRHGSLGKSEMWYIIGTDEGARIYSGLRVEMTSEDYVKRVADGSFAETLAVHQSAPGDVFFLPAGRVHAIGAGNLLAEIQESSDITYRIYDYNRRDAHGNTRELHTEFAKDAIDYTVYDDYKMPRIPNNVAEATLVNCSHFTVDRIIVDSKLHPVCGGDSFTVLMCIDGKVLLEYDSGKTSMNIGDTLLLPAVMTGLTISGKATLLMARAK